MFPLPQYEGPQYPTGPKDPGHEQLAFPGNLLNSWYPKSRLPGTFYSTDEVVLRTEVGVRSVHQNPHPHSHPLHGSQPYDVGITETHAFLSLYEIFLFPVKPIA